VTAAATANTFVSARRAGVHQLMTKEAFEREQKKQTGIPGKVVAAKQQESAHKRVRPPNAATASTREIEIQGMRFNLLNDGSKLIRIWDSSTDLQETPKKFNIAGVDFLRTKRGNLIRAKTSNATQRQPKRPQCENFTKHGKCAFGPACKFTHDPSKVAVCKDFLRSGTCASGRNCDLSHELSYHRVSACTHFLRGNCTNSACRYPHVNTPSSAAVCRPFATLGFCAKGTSCDRRHVLECPNYSNHGHCNDQQKGSCSLPHIDRAGNLRKAAKRQGKTGSEDDSDMSSDEELGSDQDMADADSDVAEDDIAAMDASDKTHALSQQHDFIAFT